MSPPQDPPPSALFHGNDTKSGQPQDRSAIEAIVKEASKGSRYWTHQQKHAAKVGERVKQMRASMARYSEDARRQAQGKADAWIAGCERERRLDRTFVHVDMDAFYAAVEMRDNPSLASVPMAVGGEMMLCTSNYEARKFGVVSAMPGYIARQLCPSLVIVPMNFEKYRKASEAVHAILRVITLQSADFLLLIQLKEYDPFMTSWSLDEASLDLTDYLEGFSEGRSVQEIVRAMRERVHATTGLTCTAGIAPNRPLAKPNGQTFLAADPDSILQLVHSQPVKRISGVGKVTASILEELFSVRTCRDIWEQRGWIWLLFSEKTARFLLEASRGLGSTASGKELAAAAEDRKSLSVERTFSPSLTGLPQMLPALEKLCEQLSSDLGGQTTCRTVTVKMKSVDFEVSQRAVTVTKGLNSSEELFRVASDLLTAADPPNLRLLGVRASNLSKADADASKPIGQSDLDGFVMVKEVEKENVAQQQAHCPVCQEELYCCADDLVRINLHLDVCLFKATAKSPRKCSSSATLDRFLAKRS